jgi:hypothetical protein
MTTSSFTKRWNDLPARTRLIITGLATLLTAMLATVALLMNSGVQAILYKAF